MPLKAREGEERAAVPRRHALLALRAVACLTQGDRVRRGVRWKQAKLVVGGGPSHGLVVSSRQLQRQLVRQQGPWQLTTTCWSRYTTPRMSLHVTGSCI